MKFKIAGLAKEKVLREANAAMEKHLDLFTRMNALSLRYLQCDNRGMASLFARAAERHYKRFDNARAIKETFERGCK